MSLNKNFLDKMHRLNTNAQDKGFANAVNWAKIAYNANEITKSQYDEMSRMHNMRNQLAHGNARDINISQQTIDSLDYYFTAINKSHVKPEENHIRNNSTRQYSGTSAKRHSQTTSYHNSHQRINDGRRLKDEVKMLDSGRLLGNCGLEYEMIFDEVHIVGSKCTEEKIVIPSYIIYDGYTYDVTHIDEYAFQRCSSLTSIAIPRSVISIGDSAFAFCSSLISIKFEDNSSLTSIGEEAFNDCSSLTSISIPKGVTKIGAAVFSSCILLRNIAIPNSVMTIGKGAFSFCSSLVSITMPNRIIDIGDYTFNYCSSLASITIPNSVRSIGEGAFHGCSSLASVRFENNSRLICIREWAFNGCNSLTSIAIPSSVVKIEDSVFFNCHSLRSIIIPNSVRIMGCDVFHYCSSLTIYAEADSEPYCWGCWNLDPRPVVWGYKK